MASLNIAVHFRYAVNRPTTYVLWLAAEVIGEAEHLAHFPDALDRPTTNVLIEHAGRHRTCCPCDAVDRPTTDVLVKGLGARTSLIVVTPDRIPRADVLVKSFGALWNIVFMSGTLWTAQSPMSWLKTRLPNIRSILVTPEVSHPLMSSLKVSRRTDFGKSNNLDMSVTPDVSQVEMWPLVPTRRSRARVPRIDGRILCCC